MLPDFCLLIDQTPRNELCVDHSNWHMHKSQFHVTWILQKCLYSMSLIQTLWIIPVCNCKQKDFFICVFYRSLQILTLPTWSTLSLNIPPNEAVMSSGAAQFNPNAIIFKEGFLSKYFKNWSTYFGPSTWGAGLRESSLSTKM